MLESVFVTQHATLIMYEHWSGKKREKPNFHIWPLLSTYKTVEEAITRWRDRCPTINDDSCCARGHHFARITQYPLNTPESYYTGRWKTDSYMAQYCYLQDEIKKQAEKKYGKPLNGPSANKHIYFGDDGKELINPKNRQDYSAKQTEYFGILNGRGSDFGWHLRDWWLRGHGFVKKDAPPVTARESQPGEFSNPLYIQQRLAQLIWPEGDNPNGW